MKRTTEPDFPLLHRADELVEELRADIPRALKEWHPKAIHQARVATRRMKAALDLLEPILSREHSKPFARILKKLRRRLGPLRDLDVMIEHLAELHPGKAALPAVAWLSTRLVEQRDVARKQASGGKNIPRVLARLGSWWGVREEIAEARDAVASLLAESLHDQVEAFAQRAELLGQDDKTYSGALPDHQHDPHQLRIAGKRLRYTLEMAAIEGHKLPAQLMKPFKQMQESLGLWHDYVVLSERAMQVSLDALLPHHNAELQAAILDLSKLLLRRAVRHLNDFHQLWGSAGAGVVASIRERFPLTRDLNGSETDPDPTHSESVPVSATAPPAEPSAA